MVRPGEGEYSPRIHCEVQIMMISKVGARQIRPKSIYVQSMPIASMRDVWMVQLHVLGGWLAVEPLRM